MVLSGVYKITNLLDTNRCYIGSSKDLQRRWKDHLYTARKIDHPSRGKVHCAIAEYGSENFSFEIMEECEPHKETLLKYEQRYLDELKPYYNLCEKAGSVLGLTVSEKKKRLHRRGNMVLRTFLITREIDEHITSEAAHMNISKSEFVRNLILKRMRADGLIT